MPTITIDPVDSDRWADLLELFGDNGAYSNCWCTWWLLTNKEWNAASPSDRRDVLHSKVGAGQEPGLIAYRDGSPIGWCAVGPRDWYGRLNSPRSRTYRRIDDAPTWVVSCFFIRKDHRGSGVATALLDAAVAHARRRGAQIVEGYPIDRAARQSSSATLFVGTVTMFTAAGFEEAHRVGDRPLMRLHLMEDG